MSRKYLSIVSKRLKSSIDKFLFYLVITFVAHAAGNGGGFSRMTTGGGVFGGVGRSK